MLATVNGICSLQTGALQPLMTMPPCLLTVCVGWLLLFVQCTASDLSNGAGSHGSDGLKLHSCEMGCSVHTRFQTQLKHDNVV